ncbi:hypothetical protein Hdeb2414_s0004g00130581 [Helianthus debilis subsp. tardiflorus]
MTRFQTNQPTYTNQPPETDCFCSNNTQIPVDHYYQPPLKSTRNTSVPPYISYLFLLLLQYSVQICHGAFSIRNLHTNPSISQQSTKTEYINGY